MNSSDNGLCETTQDLDKWEEIKKSWKNLSKKQKIAVLGVKLIESIANEVGETVNSKYIDAECYDPDDRTELANPVPYIDNPYGLGYVAIAETAKTVRHVSSQFIDSSIVKQAMNHVNESGGTLRYTAEEGKHTMEMTINKDNSKQTDQEE